MKKIQISEMLHSTYAEILMNENLNLDLINQMLKILEYGCVTLSSSALNMDILRIIKETFQEEENLTKALDKINLFKNRLIIENTVKCFYVCEDKEITLNSCKLKTIRIYLSETTSADEEKTELLNLKNKKLEHKKDSFVAKILYTPLFIKYFNNISSDSLKNISESEIEVFRNLLDQYVYDKYWHTTDLLAKYNFSKNARILYDLEHKEKLSTWEIIILNKVLYEYREKNH